MAKLKNRFDEKFVKELVEKVPKNIVEKFDLELDEICHGVIRIDNGDMKFVYFHCHTKKELIVVLKFKYRDFHYIKADFVYDGIYVCYDGINEHRYDKDFNLNAKYLMGISILPSISREEKLHTLSILNEWAELAEKLKLTNEFIECYQIEKNNKFTRNFYIISNSKIPLIWDRTKDHIKKITNNFNFDKIRWGNKAKLENKEIITGNSIYFTIMPRDGDKKINPEDINKITN